MQEVDLASRGASAPGTRVPDLPLLAGHPP
jgi:hypothetical protein